MQIVADKAIPFIRHFFSQTGALWLLDAAHIDAAAVKDADALIVRSVTRVDEALLHDSQPALVASATSGIDHVDTAYLARRGIRFAHAPGANARAVAEYVLSSLFVLAEQEGLDLAQKQVAIIGYGHVGRQLHALLQACGMRCLLNDPPLQEKSLQAQSAEGRFCGLHEALQADVVSLHVPLSRTGDHPTHHLINADTLNYLKKDVILINTSRGAVLDEAAVLAFKRQHPAARLVLDVWDNEPHINTALLRLASINTPHIAGYSADARLAGTARVYAALCQVKNTQAQNIPPPTLPAAPAAISLDAVDNDLQALQLAVLSAYDVRADSASFRQILELGRMARAAFFYDLRNNYPLRREFPATPVRLTQARAGLRAQLSAVGFRGLGFQGLGFRDLGFRHGVSGAGFQTRVRA